MANEKVMLITTRTPGSSENEAFIKEQEIRSLINTLSLCVVCHQSFTLKEENPNTYLGSGQIEGAKEYAAAFDVEEIIIDGFISPRQEKNLERIFEMPISDREAVILAIFYQNAHSKEARLQIEKAEAMYLKPRLISREANLSQQRGGVRGAKGEGERKLELERRRIDERIKILDREIEETKKIRKIQRQGRENSGIYSFALVGYTNAGKSTILNALTKANVLSEDMLFATLDTTTRSLRLPNGQKVLLSDTVGFISDLPTLLIDAFSSTLEEALNADALIIVADASHHDSVGCLETTKETLSRLGVLNRVKLMVINKIDEVQNELSYALLKKENLKIVETSFKEDIGIDTLLKTLSEITDEEFVDTTLNVDLTSSIVSELSKNGWLRGLEYFDDYIKINARIPKNRMERYAKSNVLVKTSE